MANLGTFKLIDIIDVKKKIKVSRLINGKEVMGFETINPKEVKPIVDEIHLESLLRHTDRVSFDKRVEKMFIENGIKYELVRCSSCGGRVKAIKFHDIEINLNEDYKNESAK